MDLSIRAATAADEDTIVRFNAALAWESEHKRLHEPTLRAGVRAQLADPHKGFYTVAESDGAVVGQTLITFEWSDWRNGWYWWIQSVYVAAEARRGGVFRALFEHLKAKATADPAVIGLRLYVERDNERAQRTYASLGLEEEPYRLMGLYPLPGREGAFAGTPVGG
jgi:ribosomal protein S18 acetylase RimI-like enzyme